MPVWLLHDTCNDTCSATVHMLFCRFWNALWSSIAAWLILLAICQLNFLTKLPRICFNGWFAFKTVFDFPWPLGNLNNLWWIDFLKSWQRMIHFLKCAVTVKTVVQSVDLLTAALASLGILLEMQLLMFYFSSVDSKTLWVGLSHLYLDRAL